MGAGQRKKRLSVAIIGGGPGGLGAAIELSRLGFVDWELYEKKPEISETGGGISLKPHTWRLLELNRTAQYVRDDAFFRHEAGLIEQRRNGRTGAIIYELTAPDDVPHSHQTCRLTRARLQSALLKNVDQAHVHVGKRLVRFEQIEDEKVRVFFADGFVDEVDMLIGADGIRSLIRHTCFPTYTLSYSGQCVYRSIVSKRKVRGIEDMPFAPVFWKSVSGLYVYTCPLGDDDFEVTARIRRTIAVQDQVSWGRPFHFPDLLPEFDDFCVQVQDILRLAAEGETQEFALLAGPHLDRMTAHQNIAFIGDAAHAFCGNFGAGTGFALEDVYTLGRCLTWATECDQSVAKALELYDQIRSPHYERLNNTLTKFVDIKSKLSTECLTIDEEIEARILRIAHASETWMYYYNIEDVVEKKLKEATILAKPTVRSGNATCVYL